jgi:hypothetical protein
MWAVRAGLVGLVALTAACGASRSSPASTAPKPEADSAKTAEAGSSKTRIEIDNQNYSDMSIYLLDRGTRVLLGSAAGLAKTTLLIPDGLVRSGWQVRLLADPTGGGSPIRTPALIVPPGQNVYWTIGSDPANSTASAG